MHVPSAPPAVRAGPLAGRPVWPFRRANTTRVALSVESIGYLVPRQDFAGRVHSVFVQACNVTCNDTLLTLGASGLGDGPTTLRLARDAPGDLRDWFEVGERVHGRRGWLRTARVELRLSPANVWRPVEPCPLLPPSRIEVHLRSARLRLAHCRIAHASVLDREAAPVVAALGETCRRLDREQAARQVDALIGWGEGLTPAGDDFLVGLIAGLDALVGSEERRRRFRSALAAALTCRTQRTSPIAAHHLRLAAGGHYTEPLVRLRHALLCADDSDAVDAALRCALAIGATSGAATVSGLLAGLLAWLPVPSTVEAARS
jgi:hypothetical protein